MARLLIVHHSPTATLLQLLERVVVGASDASAALEADGSDPVGVVARSALEATADDVLAADGYLLGTPANLGYMSGALKHFFDQVYEPCLDRTVGRPYGLYLHGRTDVTGARLGVERIITGLRWRAAAEPIESLGVPDDQTLDDCWNLGATMAALMG